MDNREIIQEKALRLFASRGYDAVGVQEVASESGVTKPTLYHYFGSKAGLLEEILKSRFPALLDSVTAAAEYKHDLPFNLPRLAISLFRFAEKEPDFYRMLLCLYLSPPKSEGNAISKKYLSSLYTKFEDLFKAAEKDHGNMTNRSALFAASFLSLCNSIIGFYLNGEIKLDDRIAREAVRHFQYGIYS